MCDAAQVCSRCTPNNDGCSALPVESHCVVTQQDSDSSGGTTLASGSADATLDDDGASGPGSTGGDASGSGTSRGPSSGSSSDPTVTGSTADPSATTGAGQATDGLYCGNGAAEPDEECDTEDFGEQTCQTWSARYGGTGLACDGCEVDESQCCLKATETCSEHAECCNKNCANVAGILKCL